MEFFQKCTGTKLRNAQEHNTNSAMISEGARSRLAKLAVSSQNAGYPITSCCGHEFSVRQTAHHLESAVTDAMPNSLRRFLKLYWDVLIEKPHSASGCGHGLLELRCSEAENLRERFAWKCAVSGLNLFGAHPFG